MQPFLQDKVGGGTKKIHAPIFVGIGASADMENLHPWLLGMKMLRPSADQLAQPKTTGSVRIAQTQRHMSMLARRSL